MKTQAECYEALLRGEKLATVSWIDGSYVHLVDGFLKNKDGGRADWDFGYPSDWELYPEPKKECPHCKDVASVKDAPEPFSKLQYKGFGLICKVCNRTIPKEAPKRKVKYAPVIYRDYYNNVLQSAKMFATEHDARLWACDGFIRWLGDCCFPCAVEVEE
jgi:hypothetical protein